MFALAIFVIVAIGPVLGESECPIECQSNKSNNSEQICASNGNTYESICLMKKANCSLIEVDWENCRGNHPLCPSDCLDIQDPVCAEDGKFYPNKCVLHKRNCGKKIAERSPLYCFGRNRQSICFNVENNIDFIFVNSSEETGICTSVGSYKLTQNVLKKKSRIYDSCPKWCLEFPKPVCGTDGQIYLNECYLRKSNCGNETVQVVAMDKCVKTPSCPESCLAIYDPVCGSDGKIYLNQCKMLYENCDTNIKRMPLRFCVGDDEQKL